LVGDGDDWLIGVGSGDARWIEINPIPNELSLSLSLSLARPRTRARPQGSRLFIGEPIHGTNAVSQ